MKIEIKSIKTHSGLSRETHAYTATVYVDGVASIDVSNDGHGGCDYQHERAGHAGAVDRVSAYIASNYPPMTLAKVPNWSSPATLESVCSDAVTDYLILGDMRRALRSAVVYREDGKLWSLKWRGVRKILPAHIAQARTENPGIFILNDLPTETALAVWRESSGA
jgi:hypothetical protein